MIILLYGKDTYRSHQNLKKIVKYYKKVHKSGLNLRFFDFKEDTFEDFRDEFRIQPMFGERKLMILKNAFSNKDFKKRFLDLKEDFVKSNNIILFYEKGKVLEKDPLFVFLRKNSKCQQFEPLERGRLKGWIEREFKKYGIEAGVGAKDLLLDYVGNDLWRLSNEIKKLFLYKKGKIEKKDVEKLVRAKIETDIFRTIDALAKKQKKKALSFIHEHLKRGDSPLYILAMINFQFRNILMIKERLQSQNSIAIRKLSKELNLHPFVVKKTLQLAKNFSLEELKKIYQKLFEIDLKIKTGQIEAEMAIDLLIAEI